MFAQGTSALTRLTPDAVPVPRASGARAARLDSDAARALRSFKGMEHRVEFVRELDGVRYIDDSEGTNADSTVKAVETMKAPTVIILGGSDKKNDFTELCTAIKNSPYIAHAVLIGQTALAFELTKS